MAIDIVVIIFIALCILIGYIRGFAKVAVKIIGFIASLVIALILYTPISNYIINNTEIVPNLQTVIQEKIYTKNTEEKEIDNGNIIDNFNNYIDNYTEELKSNSAEYIANSVAVTIVRGGTWIGLFLIARVLMLFLKIFASIIEKIPVVKQFNKARWNYIWSFRGNCFDLWNTCCY